MLNYIVNHVINNRTDLYKCGMNKYAKNKAGFCSVKNLKDIPLNDEIQCVPTTTTPSINLCIHPPEVNSFISKVMQSVGYHEKPIADAILGLMEQHPSAGLLDLGANIGKRSTNTLSHYHKHTICKCHV